MTRVVVVGGVSAMSAASQAKRREPGAEVVGRVHEATTADARRWSVTAHDLDCAFRRT